MLTLLFTEWSLHDQHMHFLSFVLYLVYFLFYSTSYFLQTHSNTAFVISVFKKENMENTAFNT